MLEILPRVAYLTHTRAVYHRGLRYLGYDLLPGLAFEYEAQTYAVSGFYERGEPAGTDGGTVAVAGYVQIRVVHAVYLHNVAPCQVYRRGGEDVEQRGGAGGEVDVVFLRFSEEREQRLFRRWRCRRASRRLGRRGLCRFYATFEQLLFS
jgi:hypothetical protein